MRKHTALLAILITAFTTSTSTSQAQRSNLENGIWRIDSMTRQNATLKSHKMTLRVSADTISFMTPDGVDEFQCTIDTTHAPWTIDIVVPFNDDEDDSLFKWNCGSESETQLIKGICKLEGNTLQFCLSDACFSEEFGAIICGPLEPPINDRPRSFEPKDGTLIVCHKTESER